MTPLFHAIANETTKPLKDRRLVDPGGITKDLGDFHFFDVSAVLDVAVDLVLRSFDRGVVPGRLTFMPAERTALDFGVHRAKGYRWGVFIEQISEDRAMATPVYQTATQTIVRHEDRFQFGLRDAAAFQIWAHDDATDDAIQRGMNIAAKIMGCFAMINTPRTIGRRQHMPHAGLQRKLAAARGMVGKFPLHGWTEIVLEVRPPVIAGEKVHEARLTGGKCRHFCRAHLRIRNGYLEYVSPHWRGDPALGIKQTRYRLEPTRAA